MPVAELLVVLSPVVLVGGVGFIWGRVRPIDTRPLHVLAYYVAGPALVFTSMYSSVLTSDNLLRTAALALLMYAALSLLSFALAVIKREDSSFRNAAILALAPTNCVNYGLPVIALAFGEEGFSFAIAFVIAHVLVHMTLGVGLVAWSRGAGATRNLAAIAKVPYVYALALAVLLRFTGVSLPAIIATPLAIVGQAWIPVLLLLLGLEISKAKPQRAIFGDTIALALVKLLFPPLLALSFCFLLGIQGLWRAVLVIQASMPTAVNGVLFARQFDVRPQLVATVLLAATIASPITIGLLLYFLG